MLVHEPQRRHLVAFEGLGTRWSQDPALLASLPGTAAARAHWEELRAFLLDRGFTQTTLTNFERAEVSRSARRFTYEAKSFRPETYDGIGFGPAAISSFSDAGSRRALKWMNAAGSAEYGRAIDEVGRAAALAFRYAPVDLRLLHLTRKLPLLEIGREEYRGRFGTDPRADFPAEVDALERARLVRVDARRIALTPGGMFHADSVAGLLAWRRTVELRAGAAGRRSLMRSDDEAAAHHMG